MTNETPSAVIPTYTTPKRRHKTQRTKAQWKALLDEYTDCGLTQAAFCKQHKIATSSLHKWRKHLSGKPSSLEFIDISEPLAKVETPQPTLKDLGQAAYWQVELELGAGVVLRVSAQ